MYLYIKFNSSYFQINFKNCKLKKKKKYYINYKLNKFNPGIYGRILILNAFV